MSPHDYQDFFSLIRKGFKELQDGSFQISYIDDENDKIDVDCQADYAYALQFAAKNNQNIKFIIERTSPVLTPAPILINYPPKKESNYKPPELLLSFNIKRKPFKCNRCLLTFKIEQDLKNHDIQCKEHYDNIPIKEGIYSKTLAEIKK